MTKKKFIGKISIVLLVLLLCSFVNVHASKLVSVKVIDKEYIMLHFQVEK